MKATFLHTADIHLGVKLNNKGFSLREREKRRIELWDTFEKIINIANEQQIKYIFIAGDMINQQYSNFKDLKRITGQLKKLEDAKIIITCGNNDPYTITSLYEYIEWPDNVYLFKNKDKVEKIEFPQDNICIYSASWDESDDYKSKTEQIYSLKTDNSKINILMVHADIDDKKSKFSLDSNIIKYKFDYCAMGHVHEYEKIEPNIIYPGTPEQFNFDKNNSLHGIVLGEIDKDYLKTEFMPISNRRYIYKEINIEREYNFNQILDSIRLVGKDIDTMKDYVRINLLGTISNDVSIDEIKNESKQFFYYIEFEDNYTYEKCVNESIGKFRGNIIDNYILQFENVDKQDKIYEKAFELGLKALRTEGTGV